MTTLYARVPDAFPQRELFSACDCCDARLPCVSGIWTSYAGEVWACHRCRSMESCDDCAEALESGDLQRSA